MQPPLLLLQLAIIYLAIFIMNIHSSSLAFQRVDIPTPVGRYNENTPGNQPQTNNASTPQNQQLAIAVTSPDEIEKVLSESRDGNENSASDPRTRKALAAYNEIRNQPAQQQLENIITGINIVA